jgi:cysteine synthase
MLDKAVELAGAHGYFLCRQFENQVNADVHTRTTAVEILRDLGGESLDYFVTGFGTGGTLLGVARKLRVERPGTRIVAAEPDNSPVLGSGIRQSRIADGKPSGSHPRFRPHLMQGWAPDFISVLTQDAIDNRLIDEIVPVSGNEAMALSRRLAREEGIFAGAQTSSTTMSMCSTTMPAVASCAAMSSHGVRPMASKPVRAVWSSATSSCKTPCRSMLAACRRRPIRTSRLSPTAPRKTWLSKVV